MELPLAPPAQEPTLSDRCISDWAYVILKRPPAALMAIKLNQNREKKAARAKVKA